VLFSVVYINIHTTEHTVATPQMTDFLWDRVAVLSAMIQDPEYFVLFLGLATINIPSAHVL